MVALAPHNNTYRCALAHSHSPHPSPGSYPYIGDLWALDRACPPELHCVPPELLCITSPLTEGLPQWWQALAGHPDRDFVCYVLDGIEHGFRIGFAHGSPLAPTPHNMQSAMLHSSVVSSYISSVCKEGRMLGPFPPGCIPELQTSWMGVVPKGHTPGRWRLITDLSYPEDRSVNDDIQAEWCSLRYTSVEIMAAAAQQLGQGTLLAELDIKSAYRLIPVCPHDRHLLGVKW